MIPLDKYGRLKVAFVVDYEDADMRYIRKDDDTQIDAGVTITFGDSDSDLRIRNGKLQFKFPDGYWRYMVPTLIDGSVPDLTPSDEIEYGDGSSAYGNAYRFRNGKIQLRFPDGKWRYVTPTMIDGTTPDITPSDETEDS